MTRERHTSNPATGGIAAHRPFPQLLAVALISLVLVSLAVVTGLKDLRTLDKTLSRLIEERGLDIIKDVQPSARHNFHLLGHGAVAEMNALAGSGLAEEAFSLRESVIYHLLSLAQRIDFEREQGSLEDPLLTSLTAAEGLWLLALLDPEGRPTYENRPVPEILLERAADVIASGEGIRADLFGPSGHGPSAHSLVVRRKEGQGAILFALDEEGLQFWKARVSIQQAVAEVGLGTETRYLVVTDTKGRIVFQRGEPPESSKSGLETAGRNGRGTMEIVSPLRLDGGPTLTALLGLSRESAELLLEKERERGWVFIGFMLLIALLSMGFLYRTQVRYLAQMREMERRLHRAERLSAMGRLAAGVAHEIRNPLNAMSMACQRLKPGNLEQLSRVIREEIRRLNRIVEDFIGFSRSGRPELKQADIGSLVREMALLIEEEASSREIALRLDLPEAPLMIWMDADKIRQALLNIIKNAMESIPDRGTITLALSEEGMGRVVVRISDTGVGLDPKEVERIFEPDYTTKEKGLGLGLALAHEIVAGHGGEIRVESRPGKGSIFEVVLPVGAEEGMGSKQKAVRAK